MAIYTITQGKKNFDQLVDEALAGQEVIIQRRSKPIARLVAIQRQAGTMKGVLEAQPQFFDPMTDHELKDWGIE